MLLMKVLVSLQKHQQKYPTALKLDTIACCSCAVAIGTESILLHPLCTTDLFSTRRHASLQGTYQPGKGSQRMKAKASVRRVLAWSVTAWSFQNPRCICTKQHRTAQIHFVYIWALKGVVKDYPYIQRTWENTILLFPEPGGKGDYNFPWQYLVVLAHRFSLFFPLFLQSLSYSFQAKSLLQTMMSYGFLCPVYWPAKNPMQKRCGFLINDSIKTQPQGDLMKAAQASRLLHFATTECNYSVVFLRLSHSNRYFALIY